MLFGHAGVRRVGRMQSRLNASQTTDNPKAESSGDEPENKSGGASPAEGAEVATEGVCLHCDVSP